MCRAGRVHRSLKRVRVRSCLTAHLTKKARPTFADGNILMIGVTDTKPAGRKMRRARAARRAAQNLVHNSLLAANQSVRGATAPREWLLGAAQIRAGQVNEINEAAGCRAAGAGLPARNMHYSHLEPGVLANSWRPGVMERPSQPFSAHGGSNNVHLRPVASRYSLRVLLQTFFRVSNATRPLTF
jgi:hypothetical protein